MSTKIWMPLYIADYLADTTRLTTEQHGAYMLLIMDYWRNGPLPNDDEALANITRLSTAAWKKHRAAMLRFFDESGDQLRHGRIDKELKDASENAEKHAERARKAAAKRWGKDTTSNATSNATSTPQAVLDECPSPSPSSSSIPNGIETPNASEILFDRFWKAYPKKVGKEAARKAFSKVKRPTETIEMITEALAWQTKSEQWVRDGGQYIPNPATYLNQARWMDEPQASTARKVPARENFATADYGEPGVHDL
jgi:uncharacterized protein YdaU (DUF1376 family)